MDDLLREFVGEALDQLEDASADLVAWERDPADRDALDRIFRVMHTIKGSSSFFELPRITGLAHAAEEALEAMRNLRGAPDGGAVSLVLESFDACRQLVSGVTAMGIEPDVALDKLIQRLGDHTCRQDSKQTDDLIDGDLTAPFVADQAASWRTVRVPLDLLDTLLNAVSDLVLTRNELVAQLRADRIDVEAMPAFDRFNGQLVAVRGIVSGMRMVPLRQIFAPLPRLVRQLSNDLGKPVQFVADGGEVEIDREVGEALRDPLIHLLRNAIDHGVETTRQRQSQSKEDAATIRVNARRNNNRIAITIADDGQGIDVAKVVERAIAAAVISAEAARNLTPQAKLDLIFNAGLSTSDVVTSISGRGVGMDVIKANVERIGGRVTLDNMPGRGLTVTLDVPMTLTIVNALAIPVAGQDFAVPRAAVEEVMMMGGDNVQYSRSGETDFVRIRGRLMPMLIAEHLLTGDLTIPADDHDRALLVLRGAGDRRIALCVPDVRDIAELVIKPVPPMIAAAGLFSGMSLPDSGRPLLVIDVEGLLSRCTSMASDDDELYTVAPDPHSAAQGDAWLFLSRFGHPSRCAVPMAVIERIVDVPRDAIRCTGGRWVVHHLEDIFAVSANVDALPTTGIVRLIKIVVASRALAIDAYDIGHIVQLDPAAIRPADAEDILGLVSFGHEVVELIDVHTLLSRAGSANTQIGTNRPITQPTVWMMAGAMSDGPLRLLAPLIEQAGYRCKMATEPGMIPEDAAAVLCITVDGADDQIDVTCGNHCQTVDLWDKGAVLAAIRGVRAA